MRYTLIIISFILFASCVKLQKADLVIHNAKIYTVNENFDIAQAMAIKDGKIIAIGKEHEIKNKYRADEFFDAQTQPVYPGFIDAHAHLIGYGLNQLAIDLSKEKNLTEIVEKLKSYKKNNPKAKWVIGFGWDENKWDNKEVSNEILNQSFSDIPVLLWRVDGHQLLVNDKAVEASELDKTNCSLGIVKDKYINQFVKAIKYSKSQKKQALRIAQEACLKQGLTSVVDAGITNDELSLYKQFDKNGNLDIRVYGMLKPSIDNLKEMNNGIHLGDYFTARSLKLVLDGSLGSASALLLDNYKGKSTNGDQLLTGVELMNYYELAKENKYQIAIHCIGDKAFRMAIDSMGKVLRKQNDLRWRIEHAQMVHPSDINKIAKYSIIPSVQPKHGVSDMEWAKNKIGEKRLNYSYQLRTLKKQNGFLALGTDFPVESITPVETFYTSVVRENDNGDTKEYLQKEKLERQGTLRDMTFWNAFSQFQQDNIGTLEVGKKADFVILNRDILTVTEQEIKNTEVRYTFVNGYKMYEMK